MLKLPTSISLGGELLSNASDTRRKGQAIEEVGDFYVHLIHNELLSNASRSGKGG